MSKKIKLWRYMDLTKFLDLILYQRLYFNRSDNFEDKHEGELDRRSREWLSRSIFNKALATPLKGDEAKCEYFINCWHQNDYESAAMWKIYGIIPDAIAITTDLDKLYHNLSKKISIKKVTYYDERNSFDINDHNLTQDALFTRKRNSFIHENEYRAIYHFKESQWSDLPNEFRWVEKNGQKKGINVTIDLNKIIDEIIISPHASPLILPIIQKILNEIKFDKIPITESKLYQL